MLGTPFTDPAADRLAPPLPAFQRARDATTGSARRFTGAFEGGHLHKSTADGFAPVAHHHAAWTPATFRSSRTHRAATTSAPTDLDHLLDDEDRRMGLGRRRTTTTDRQADAGLRVVAAAESLGHAVMRRLGWSHAAAYRLGETSPDGPDRNYYKLAEYQNYAARLKQDARGLGYDPEVHGGEVERGVEEVRRRQAPGARHRECGNTALRDEREYAADEVYGEEIEDVYEQADARGEVRLRDDEDAKLEQAVKRARLANAKANPAKPTGLNVQLAGFVAATHAPPRRVRVISLMVPEDFAKNYKGHVFQPEIERLKKWKVPQDLVTMARRICDADARMVLAGEKAVREEGAQAPAARDTHEKRYAEAATRFVDTLKATAGDRFAPSGSTETAGSAASTAVPRQRVLPGTTNRRELTWQPVAILCKRFGVKTVPRVALVPGSAPSTSRFSSAGFELDNLGARSPSPHHTDDLNSGSEARAATVDTKPQTEREKPADALFQSIFGDSDSEGQSEKDVQSRKSPDHRTRKGTLAPRSSAKDFF